MFRTPDIEPALNDGRDDRAAILARWWRGTRARSARLRRSSRTPTAGGCSCMAIWPTLPSPPPRPRGRPPPPGVAPRPLRRWETRLADAGMAGLLVEAKGPKRESKLTADTVAAIRRLREDGVSNRRSPPT